MENKLFLGLGIVTIICGILLAMDHQFLIGISGSVVGVCLVVSNWNKIKAQGGE